VAVPGVTDLVADPVISLGNIMKTRYGPAIVQQQNLTPMLYKLFDRSTVEFGGHHYEFPARLVNIQSIGPRGYRTALPQALGNTDVTVQVFHKFLYGVGDISGPDIERAKTRTDAFVNALTDKLQSLTESFLKDANFQTYLPGTGAYATVTAAVGPGAVPVPVDVVKYFRVGRRVDLWSNAGSSVLEAAATNGRVVQSIDAPGKTITFNVAIPALAIGDLLIPETGVATGGTQVGIFLNGLGAIVDDGTNVNIFQNVNRTVNPQWKASILSNGGIPRDLSLQLMQLLMDVPETKSGKVIDFLIGSYNARNQYLQLLVSQKRFMEMKLDGGFQTLEFNGKSFLVDVDCQDDTIYGLHRNSIKRFGLFDMKFDDTTGSVLRQAYIGGNLADFFSFYLKMYGNLGTDQCNANAKITDLAIDSSYLIAG
jgi:hypothetical protein